MAYYFGGTQLIPNVATFTIPQNASGSYIHSFKWNGVNTFMPYIGMRPPPPLFGKRREKPVIFAKPFEKLV